MAGSWGGCDEWSGPGRGWGPVTTAGGDPTAQTGVPSPGVNDAVQLGAQLSPEQLSVPGVRGGQSQQRLGHQHCQTQLKKAG